MTMQDICTTRTHFLAWLATRNAAPRLFLFAPRRIFLALSCQPSLWSITWSSSSPSQLEKRNSTQLVTVFRKRHNSSVAKAPKYNDFWSPSQLAPRLGTVTSAQDCPHPLQCILKGCAVWTSSASKKEKLCSIMACIRSVERTAHLAPPSLKACHWLFQNSAPCACGDLLQMQFAKGSLQSHPPFLACQTFQDSRFEMAAIHTRIPVVTER